MSPKEHHTPITSPLGSDDEDIFTEHVSRKPDAKLLSSSPSAPSVPHAAPENSSEKNQLPRTPTPSKEAKQVRIQAPGSSPLSAKKFQVPAWRASYLSKFATQSPRRKTQKPAVDSDSDSDDLEILPPQPSNAMRKLADLAGVNSVPAARTAKGTPTKRQDQDLILSIQAKQKEQILRDRQEKEEEVRARGKVVNTEEEIEEDLKEELWDQARREAERIRKREKELAKQEAKSEALESEDEEEAEFKLDVEDNEEGEEGDESDADLVVDFYDEEAKDEEEEDEEAKDDKDDDENEKEEEDEGKEDWENETLVKGVEGDIPATELIASNLSDKEDADVPLTVRSTNRRRGRISNEEDEDEAYPPVAKESSKAKDGDGLLSMSQLFQDSQAVPINTQTGGDKLRAAANSLTQEGELPANIALAAETVSIGSNSQHTITSTQDVSKYDFDMDAPPTQLSQFPAPTPMSQHKLLPLGDLWDSSDEDDETQPTENLPAIEESKPADASKSPVAPKLRRLKQLASDNEDEIDMTPAKPKKKKKQPVKIDRAQAREMADEEAVESDDEWAGLGGNSDDEMDPQMAAELQKMVDDSGNANEGAADLQKLFAQKERNQDEALVNKLLQDVANGGWRKRKHANGSLLDGLSDEEDEEEDRKRNEYRMRKARQEARRRGKLIGENDELSAMSRNPKAKAFLEAIADDSSFLDSKKYFVDEPSDEEESDDQEEKEDAKSATPPGPSDTPSVGSEESATNDIKHTESESSSTTNSMGPPTLNSTAAKPTSILKDKSARKKRKLTTEYIRETLSFLDEDNDTSAIDPLWQPSRTLGDAISKTDLISDNEDEEMLDASGESMLGEPDIFAKPALPVSKSRVVNRRLQRKSMVSSGSSVNLSYTSISTTADPIAIDVSKEQNNEDEDEDDDGIVFKGTSFASITASFRAGATTIKPTKPGPETEKSNMSYATVTIGGASTSASGKASINYQTKRKLGVGIKRVQRDAEDMASKLKRSAVEKAIRERQQSSLFSQGSWD